MITLATLPEKTAQEVFTHIVTNLAAQKCQSTDYEGNCKYRGSSGMKCAAGWCIGDDEYDLDLDKRIDNSWTGIVDDGVAPENHKSLIQDCQDIHDNFHFGDWENEFTILANRLELEMPKVDWSE